MAKKVYVSRIATEAHASTMCELLDASSIARVIHAVLIDEINGFKVTAETERTIDVLNGIAATADMLADKLLAAHEALDAGTLNLLVEPEE